MAADLTGVPKIMNEGQVDRVFEYLRAVVVSLFYFVSCLMLGVGSWKASCLSVGFFALQAMGIGIRRIEQLSFVFFLGACLVWMGLVPVGMKHFELAIEIGKTPVSVTDAR